jgi:hypothetical protein
MSGLGCAPHGLGDAENFQLNEIHKLRGRLCLYVRFHKDLGATPNMLQCVKVVVGHMS